MRVAWLGSVAVAFLAGVASGQERGPPNGVVMGVGSDLLSRGAEAILAGRYHEGIDLTKRGLEEPDTTDRERAAALSNLCAAYAVIDLPDTAIAHCTESLAIDDGNWRAFSNRSFAYWIKGQLAAAEADLEAAQALNPYARQVAQIRGMINESGLRPRIRIEELQ